MNKAKWISAVVGLLFANVVYATPVVYFFTGIGEVRPVGDSPGPGLSGITFTGTVTIDVHPSGPTGSDVRGNSTTWISDPNGWVTSDFNIRWFDSSGHEQFFNPTMQVGDTASLSGGVYNDHMSGGVVVDELAVGESYEQTRVVRQDGQVREERRYLQSASLSRRTADTSWLADLGFPLGPGLAPGAGAQNMIYFYDYTENSTYLGSRLASHYLWGISGSISLTSLVARVPEPVALVLFASGLIGIGAARKRCRAEKSHRS